MSYTQTHYSPFGTRYCNLCTVKKTDNGEVFLTFNDNSHVCLSVEDYERLSEREMYERAERGPEPGVNVHLEIALGKRRSDGTQAGNREERVQGFVKEILGGDYDKTMKALEDFTRELGGG